MIQRFNNWVAIKVTDVVATMWCAYAFAVIALVSLPNVISSGNIAVMIAWVAQTFLQLVLLSVIMVGQKVQTNLHIDLHEKIDVQSDLHVDLHKKVDALHEKVSAI